MECGVALSVAAFSGCGDEEEGASSGGGPGGGRGGWGGGRGGGVAAIPVKAENVVRGEMNAYVETYARQEAEREISVLARASGFLEELGAEEGDRVETGQVLGPYWTKKSQSCACARCAPVITRSSPIMSA